MESVTTESDGDAFVINLQMHHIMEAMCNYVIENGLVPKENMGCQIHFDVDTETKQMTCKMTFTNQQADTVAYNFNPDTGIVMSDLSNVRTKIVDKKDKDDT